MSNIEEYIARATWDGAQFEKGARETLKTLDEFNKKMNFEGAEKSAHMLAGAGDAVHTAFDKVGDSVKKSGESFIAWVAKATLVQDVTRKLIGTTERFVKSITTDQISAGLDKYSKITRATQTIAAATGKTISEIDARLAELNEYTDMTSYDFSEMVNSIGKFTSVGVDLGDAITAMKGIGNEAARSGAGIQEANRAMYNFAQALAQGEVKLMDWKSIENANMATKEFKEQIIETAKEVGTLDSSGHIIGATGQLKDAEVTFQSFNETLSAGWFNSEVLIKVLKKYGDTATDIGKQSYEAAKQALTFEDAINAIKDSVSSGWMRSFQIVFGDLEEAAEFFTDLCDSIIELLDVSTQARNAVLENWKMLGGRSDLLDGLKNLWESFSSLWFAVRDAIRNVFNPFEAHRGGLISLLKDETESLVSSNVLVDITKGIKDFGTAVRQWLYTPSSNGLLMITNIRLAIEGILTVVKNVVGGVRAAISAVEGALGPFGSVVYFVLSHFIGGPIGMIIRMIGWFKTAGSPIFTRIISDLGSIGVAIKEFFSGNKDAINWTGILQKIAEGFRSIWDAIKNFSAPIGGFFKNLFEKHGFSGVITGIFDTIRSKGSTGLNTFREFINGIGLNIESLKEKFKDHKIIENATKWITKFIGSICEKINWARQKIRSVFGRFSNSFSSGFKGISEWFKGLFSGQKANGQSDLQTQMGALGVPGDGGKSSLGFLEWLSKVWNSMKGIFSTLGKAVESVTKTISAINWADALARLQGIVNWGVGVVSVFSVARGFANFGAGFKLFGKGFSSIGKGVASIGKSSKKIVESVSTNITTVGQALKGVVSSEDYGIAGVLRAAKEKLTKQGDDAEDSAESIGTTILKFAAAIAIITGAIYVLSEHVDWNSNSAIYAVSTIGGLIFFLAAVSIALNKLNTVKDDVGAIAWGVQLLQLSVAIGILAGVLAALSYIPDDAYKKGAGRLLQLAVIVGALVIVTGAASLISKGNPFKVQFLSIAVFIGAMIWMVNTLSTIPEYKIMDICYALWKFVEIIIVLELITGLSALIGKGNAFKVQLLSIVIALGAFILFAKQLMSMPDIDSGISKLLGLVAIITFLQIMSGVTSFLSRGFNFKAPLLSAAAAIGLLMLVVKEAAKIDPAEYWSGLGRIVLLGILITAIQVVMMVLSKLQRGAKLSFLGFVVALVVSLIAVAAALTATAFLDPAKMWSFAGSFVLIIGAITAALAILSKINAVKMLIGVVALLVTLAAGLTTFVDALSKLSTLDIDSGKILAFAGGFAIAMLGLAGALALLSTVAGPLAVVVVALGALLEVVSSGIKSIGDAVAVACYDLNYGLDKIKDVDETAPDKLYKICEQIAKVFTDFGGQFSSAGDFKTFCEQLAGSASHLAQFSDLMKDVKPQYANSVRVIYTAIKTIVQNTIPNAKPLHDFTLELMGISADLLIFSANMAGVKTIDAVKVSMIMGIISPLTKNVPNLNGLHAATLELVGISSDLVLFGDNMGKVSIDNTGKIGTVLTDLNGVITSPPDTNGLHTSTMGLFSVSSDLLLFSAQMAAIDTNNTNKISTIAGQISSANESFNAITNLGNLGTSIEALGAGIGLYYGELSKITTNADGSYTLPEGLDIGKAFDELSKQLPSVDSMKAISQFGTTTSENENDLLNFALGIEALSTAVSSYSNAIGDKGFENASKITGLLEGIKALQDPPTDTDVGNVFGFVHSVGGREKLDLNEFASNIVSLAGAVQQYANALEGKNIGALTESGNFLKAVRDATAAPQDVTNAWSFFASLNKQSGTFDGTVLGENIVSLGTAVAEYSKSIENVEIKPLTKSGEFLTAIAAIQNPPTATDLNSAWGFFSSVCGLAPITDLNRFAENVTNLGTAVQNYYSNVEGKDFTVAQESATFLASIKALMGDDIEGADPNPFARFMDRVLNGAPPSAEQFAADIRSLGTGVAAFCKAMSEDGIDINKAKIGVDIIGTLTGISNYMEPLDGLIGILTGHKDLGVFGLRLGMLGDGLAKFMVAVGSTEGDIGKVDVNRALDAAKVVDALSEAQSKLQKEGGLFGMFEGNIDYKNFMTGMEYLGEGIDAFNTKVNAITTLNPNLSMLAEAAAILAPAAGVAKEMQGVKENDFDILATGIMELGRTIRTFDKDFGDTKLSDGTQGILNFLDQLMELKVRYKESVEEITMTGGMMDGAALTKLATDINGFGSQLKSPSIGNIQAVGESLNTLLDLFTATGATYSSNIVTGMETEVPLEEDRIYAIADSIATYIDSKKGRMDISGRYLMQGLANGINTNASAPVSAAARVANQVLNVIDKTWNEHSPSVEGERRGAYLIEGIANGVRSSSEILEDAVTEAVTGGLDAADKTISRAIQVYGPKFDIVDPKGGGSGFVSSLSKVGNTLAVNKSGGLFAFDAEQRKPANTEASSKPSVLDNTIYLANNLAGQVEEAVTTGATKVGETVTGAVTNVSNTVGGWWNTVTQKANEVTKGASDAVSSIGQMADYVSRGMQLINSDDSDKTQKIMALMDEVIGVYGENSSEAKDIRGMFEAFGSFFGDPDDAAQVAVSRANETAANRNNGNYNNYTGGSGGSSGNNWSSATISADYARRYAGSVSSPSISMSNPTTGYNLADVIARMDLMEQAIRSMQLVLDTGAVVGGIETDMDRRLGHSIAMSDRGN